MLLLSINSCPISLRQLVLFSMCNRSQKLTSIGSKWEYGPELVDRTPVSQQCAVKVFLFLFSKKNYWINCSKQLFK
jgi:hypothetical protein